MKELILVRHAKSSWKHNVIDHERPLNGRGFSDANLVSKYLHKKGLEIDAIVSSDAIRAKTTAEIFISNLSIEKHKVVFNHELYDFSGTKLTEVIRSSEPYIDKLMLFGHNHAITNFVNTYGDLYIDNVPTCGVVTIAFPLNDWGGLKPGKTIGTLFPKDLK
ncbi:histidine phosphatase family protein [Tamlana sp. 2201CG12-4]|uniref:SixA phosphatase family protein n=1 Tax=Tamlana sp. 2201CG12-4 TaxID=3112582 RepID=UPI002DC03C68|nr:histidine phosphatase family protein [Tamlana sp. 2201CG12-4]MEC3908192.1 histidine phosphatase family protein [Tamlana sp. 2201CG12-4]